VTITKSIGAAVAGLTAALNSKVSWLTTLETTPAGEFEIIAKPGQELAAKTVPVFPGTAPMAPATETSPVNTFASEYSAMRPPPPPPPLYNSPPPPIAANLSSPGQFPYGEPNASARATAGIVLEPVASLGAEQTIDGELASHCETNGPTAF